MRRSSQPSRIGPILLLPSAGPTPALAVVLVDIGTTFQDAFIQRNRGSHIAHILAPLVSLPQPLKADVDEPTAVVQQELKALRKEVKELRKHVTQQEQTLRALEGIRANLEGRGFDTAMTRIWGKDWNPKRILASEKPAAPGLGLSEQEWQAVLEEA